MLSKATRPRLPRAFFARDTIDVARELLGHHLVLTTSLGQRMCGRIIETEAYLGLEDPAAHSFGGRRTPRTEVMYGEAGLSYVYFIYGMYFCFNVITRESGIPEAVLVRALAPVQGLAPGSANGPGKLCRAMGINLSHNRLDLTLDPGFFIEEGRDLPASASIAEGPRIGLNPEQDSSYWPLRFGIHGHPDLSPPRFPPPP